MIAQTLNILVLFAGAGLATRGLLDAGHTCTDVELQPAKQHLSKILNPEATHILADVRDLDPAWIATFDAVWASPPCQKRSLSNTTENSKTRSTELANELDELLLWSLGLKNQIVWVENVIEQGGFNEWGIQHNAAQYLERPVQLRQRVIGGRYRYPLHYRGFKPTYIYDGWQVSPAVTASMWKRLSDKTFRNSTCEAFYGYVPTLDEIAHLQGVDAIPLGWYDPPTDWGGTYIQWRNNLYVAIGNGVPVYMARAFGEAYSNPVSVPKMFQKALFAA